jgi:beta-barrel assembly-enhancing protease
MMTSRLIALAALVYVSAFSQPAASGVNFYSIAREAELGRTISDNLRATLTIIDDPQVARVVATLVAHAVGPFEYHVLVFADARRLHSVEPQAVAGGWIFVPASLVNGAAGEPQLAAMLAHSMAHVASRHATRLATKRDLLQMSVDGLPQKLPAVIPVSMAQGLPFAFAKIARPFELEADAVAITTLTESGYDPHALIDYIRTLPSEPNRLLTSMADPAVRISRIQARLEPAR